MNQIIFIQNLIELLKENNIDEIKNIIQNNSVEKNSDLLYILSRSFKKTNFYEKEILKLLIPYSDCKIYASFPLRFIASFGDLEFVKLLIPHSNCKAEGSEALRVAAMNGYYKIVKELAPFSNINAKKQESIISAIENEHFECVEILLPYSNIEQLKLNLKSHFNTNDHKYQKTIEIIHDYLLNIELNKELKTEINQANNKNKRKI